MGSNNLAKISLSGGPRKGSYICGSSSQERDLASQESSFASTLNANYAQNFGKQSDILSQLTNIFTPIAEAGPDQQGWGPQERAAVNTQIGEGVGSNYAKATEALNTQLSARGGGNEFLPTGSEAALRGGIATAAANQQSGEQLAATEANYAQGRSNFGQATAGLNALSQEYNPNAIAGEATQANQSAFGQASKINQENNQWESDLAGIATGGVKAGLSFLTGGLSNLAPQGGGASAGEQVGNFFTGGLQGLQG